MIVKAIYKDKEHDYFRDKSTAENIQDQVKRYYGDIFECDDDLAEERIKKGLVKKATKKEEKQYYDSIDTTNDESDIPISTEQEEQQMIDDINNNCSDELKQSNDGEE